METIAKLSDEDKTFLADVINNFGDGQHPYLTKDNVEYTIPDYTEKCLESGLDYAKTHKGLSKELARMLSLKIDLFS
jgi:hypothetical protein